MTLPTTMPRIASTTAIVATRHDGGLEAPKRATIPGSDP